MFGKKKKAEEQEIARSALDLWAFIKAVLVFVEEDPNRVKAFLKVMCDVKGTPTRDTISETRDDMKRCIAWVSQSMVVTESKIGDK